MAPESRQPPPRLIAALEASPGSFTFDQAVRLLELYGLASGTGRSVGADAKPPEESVGFAVHPSVAYAASPIRSCRPADDGAAAIAELDVTFAGLFGAAGVLPPHYSELVLERGAQGDRSLRDFLDLLQRRTIALFHRAWRRSRYPFAFELEAHERLDHDAFTTAVLSLVGLGTPSVRRKQAVDDLSFVFTGGAYARAVRSGSALAGVLRSVLRVPVEVEEFVGEWRDIPEDGRSTLLRAGEAEQEGHALGEGFAVGERFWSVQSKIRLIAGPLTLDEHRFFAGDSAGRFRAASLVQMYVSDPVDVDLECVLAPGESPGLQLGGETRIGVDAWLEYEPRPAAVRRARFPVSECA
ncbi:MAG: type VI secretion system baseplate subunit TssG [Planctomycetota bacterium]